MATREQIKKAILDTSANPSAGVVVEWVDRWADAIVALDEPQPKRGPGRSKPDREVRVVEPDEEREL